MKITVIFICALFFSITLKAQSVEEIYKSSLDSLNFYIHAFQQQHSDDTPHRPLYIVSTFHPTVHLKQLQEDRFADTTSSFFIKRSEGRKDCIFLCDQHHFLVLYLKDIDTAFIQPWGKEGIRISDSCKKEKKRKKLLFCSIAREENNKGGLLLEEFIIEPIPGMEYNRQKLLYCFKEVIQLAKDSK